MVESEVQGGGSGDPPGTPMETEKQGEDNLPLRVLATGSQSGKRTLPDSPEDIVLTLR